MAQTISLFVDNLSGRKGPPVPLEVLPVARKSVLAAGSMELAISPAGLGSAVSQQSGWGASEFQTVTEACSALRFGRPFPTVDTSVDSLGTSTWPEADELRALLASNDR
jgi:hypothetical protein